jgi:hypothetical protein
MEVCSDFFEFTESGSFLSICGVVFDCFANRLQVFSGQAIDGVLCETCRWETQCSQGGKSEDNGSF